MADLTRLFSCTDERRRWLDELDGGGQRCEKKYEVGVWPDLKVLKPKSAAGEEMFRSFCVS